MPRETIAAFDFDGTLTYHDTLIHFLRYCKGTLPSLWHLLCVAPHIAIYLSGKEFRQTLKEHVLKQFLAGLKIQEVSWLGSGFAYEKLPRLLRPEALARLRWHQDQGHRCAIVSATLDVYLEPWAATLGIYDVISSRLETDEDERVTGKLIGKNCRGKEKVRRLIEHFGPKANYDLYVYGDSRGDSELLALADHAYYRQFPCAGEPS